MSAPLELRSLYRDGRLLPFVGAGVSASVEWPEAGVTGRGPSWEEMVNRAATELGFQDPQLIRARGTDLQILEYFKLKFSGHTRLTNWLLKSMNPPDEAILKSPIHQELALMTVCSMVYTTNFDDFIERSFGLHQRAYRAVAIEEHMRPEPNTTEIIKFHGDWNHPDRMVLTESDYERRMEFTEPMDLRLWSDLLNRSVLFLGYSFRDPNVAYLFRQVKERFARLPNTSSGRRAYIVVQDPSQFERRLFQERNIEVIPIDGRGRTEAVAALLNDIRS
ncbi:MAG TPA: SIR2 family protein [Bryobacteraceae bacterium]|nr:SIR2 family protein [Bryobacteraceae bacterium]